MNRESTKINQAQAIPENLDRELHTALKQTAIDTALLIQAYQAQIADAFGLNDDSEMTNNALPGLTHKIGVSKKRAKCFRQRSR